MSRHVQKVWTVLCIALVASTGCHPQQPYFFFEDGDLSHYLDVATELEYPDVEEQSLAEVKGTHEPLTLENADSFEMWDLTLEECVQHTLANSKVIRSLGGRITGKGPEYLTGGFGSTADSVRTTLDPAIVDSNFGPSAGGFLSGGNGVEAALADFDANWSTSVFWEKNDRPQNFGTNPVFPPVFDQDLGTFRSEINKTAASGGTFAFRNNTVYDANNSPLRALYSDWNTNFEAEARQPLLQGAGAQYNRIAGPFSPTFGGSLGFDGVVIARIRNDITLAEFEGSVRDLLEEVEQAYYDLYFAYRDLEAKKLGRNSALQSWKKINALANVGARGGEAEKEAQARAQYFLFRSEVEGALTNLYRAETNLRYLMGLAMADGRLVRPVDEPTTARVAFDWLHIHPEALIRRSELRRQKWQVNKREMELIAARNHLMPRLDAVGRYRWLGMGDDLIDSTRSGLGPTAPGSNAFESLTGGNFQEWQMGLTLDIPIGFRRELAGVRHHQLLLARERAVLKDMELEVSHQLGNAAREVVNFYTRMHTNFNRRVAAEKEVEAVEAAYEAGNVTLDLVLDAQRRRADSEIAYYRSLVDYNLAIMQVHRCKGSLLEYNEVYLAEGPWPKKAYFDAMREARKRDAGTYIDYGFTRPRVFSRGPIEQGVGGDIHELDGTVYQDGASVLEDVPAVPQTLEPMPAPMQEEMPVPSDDDNSAQGSGGRNVTSRVTVRPTSTSEKSSTPANRSQPSAPARQAKATGGPILQLSYTDLVGDSKTNEVNANHTNGRTSSPAPGWKRAQR